MTTPSGSVGVDAVGEPRRVPGGYCLACGVRKTWWERAVDVWFPDDYGCRVCRAAREKRIEELTWKIRQEWDRQQVTSGACCRRCPCCESP